MIENEIMETEDLDDKMYIVDNSVLYNLDEKYPEIFSELEEHVKEWALD